MSSRLSPPEVEDGLACNLIPMIDIMFLLLLFFMLSADMSNRELEEMELPVADQAKEDKNEKGLEGVTMVNIHHAGTTQGVQCPQYISHGTCSEPGHWLITIRGQDYTPETIGDRLTAEAQLELEDTADPGSGKKLSKRKVMIRADGLSTYGYVQKVFEGCALAGIYKIEIAAARPMP